MPRRLRERAGSDSGFTLIELLVVMLILGVLAAIVVPQFLNQKNKASDAGAKAQARTLQTAMEICGNENGSSYSSCDIDALRATESSIPQTGTSVDADPGNPAGGWTVSAVSANGNTFEIEKAEDAAVSRNCTVPSGNDRGGCPPGGNW